MFDLHSHSYCSDGTDAPETVVEKAAALGLSLFALTDHDTMRGVGAAMRRAKEAGVPMLAGCELEAEYADTLHILALGVDAENEALLRLLKIKEQTRRERNEALEEKLRALGMDVSSSLGDCPGLITRAHYAHALVTSGYAKDALDAFARFLGRGRPAYVQAKHPSPGEVISTIHAAGGIAVIAHPMKMDRCDPAALIADMKRLGIDGVEAFYCGATEGETRLFASLARSNALFVTCGSDYHGARRPSSPIGGAWQDCEALIQTEKLLLSRFF